MQLIKKKLTEIKPYKRNPRINDNAVEAVKESIRQCEYVAPIVVDEKGVILAGHTRYKALKEMGVDEIEVCVKSGLTEEQKKKYRILDNKTAELADWDFDLLAQELDGLDFDGFDFGFDSKLSPDEFGEEFSLPDGEKPDMCKMSFQVHTEQKELIDYALSCVKDDITETFGNTNKNGNALYEVVRQWAEHRE